MRISKDDKKRFQKTTKIRKNESINSLQEIDLAGQDLVRGAAQP